MALKRKGVFGRGEEGNVAEFLQGLANGEQEKLDPPPIPVKPGVEVQPIRFLPDECRLVNAFTLAMDSVRSGSSDLEENAILTLENVHKLVPVVTSNAAKYFKGERARFDETPPDSAEAKDTLFFKAAKILVSSVSENPDLLSRYFDRQNPVCAMTTLKSNRAEKAFKRVFS